MKYTIIDTNIFVRIISQGRPGCEITHFNALRQLIEDEKITLLLPEVIQLELAKNWRSFTESVEIQIGKMEKELDNMLHKSFWSEIDDVQKSLKDFLIEQKAKKICAATERYEKVLSLLTSPKIVTIPFTVDINFRARKRLMAGRMPKPENRAHSDACIIESLAVYFLNVGHKDQHELYFCSENVADFALAANKRFIINPLHKDDLPAASEYCVSLADVITLIESNQKAVAPSPTVIKDALQQQTEDEVDDQIETEAEQKPEVTCAIPNCYAQRFIVSRYCFDHYEKRLANLSAEDRKSYDKQLYDILATLTFREREILKLRWGLGDGYTYTPSECARIFKITPQRVGQIEAKAIKKLQHPVRRRALDELLT